MSLSTRLRVGIGLLVFIFLSKDSLGAISLTPSNAVAELNGQTVFYTEATQFRGSWYFSKTGILKDELTIVIPPCVVSTGYGAHYGTDATGGTNACNLIVTNITMEQAGIYRYGEQDSFSALLTVTEKSPNVKYNTTAGVVVEKDDIIIECALTYNASLSPAPSLRLYFYWTDSNGQNVSSSYNSTTENMALSQLTVKAGRQDITRFTCHVYFQLIPPTNTGYANNTPIVSNNASSPIIEVQYKPSEIDISRAFSNLTNRKVVCGISQLTCHVTANPMPLYDWFDITNSIDIQLVSDNEQFSFAEDNRTYSCTAYNYIRGIENVVSSTYIVIGSKTSNPPCKFPHNSAMEITADGATCEGRQCKCIEEQPVRLTCIVDAYPIATYQWYMDDMFLTEGASYIATYNGIYICIAAGNVANVAIKSITLINCKTSPEKPETDNPVSGNDPSQESTKIAAIVLGVILGLSLSGNVALTSLLVQRRRKEETNSSRSATAKTVKPDEDTNSPAEHSTVVTYQGLRPMTNREQPTLYADLTAHTSDEMTINETIQNV